MLRPLPLAQIAYAAAAAAAAASLPATATNHVTLSTTIREADPSPSLAPASGYSI